VFAVIFEVQPKPAHFDDYLGYAKLLKPELERIDGFIDNERFASRRTEGRVLSLSTWRDEKALIRWRTLAVHHEVQQHGRDEVFADYHLRVGEIVADTHVPPGHVLREQRFDVTDVGAATIVTIAESWAEPAASPGTEVPPAPDAQTAGLIDVDLYDSIYNPGKVLILSAWHDETALARAPGPFNGDASSAAVRRRTVRIIRDYGMFERREAPQYYPAIAIAEHP